VLVQTLNHAQSINPPLDDPRSLVWNLQCSPLFHTPLHRTPNKLPNNLWCAGTTVLGLMLQTYLLQCNSDITHLSATCLAFISAAV